MSYPDRPRPAPTSEDFEADERSGYLGSLRSVGRFRVAALVGMVALTWAYASVLVRVTDVVGGGVVIEPVILAALVAAVLAARFLRPRWAATVAALAFVGGTGYYLFAVPNGVALLLDRTGELVADSIALLTGLQVVQMTRADIWAAGFVPAPVFLSWYLALRRRYLAGVVVGGAALFVLVLTNDAGPVTTLAGVLGGIAAVGLGELDRRGGTLLQADVLVVLVAVIAVAAPFVSLVPGTPVDPLELNLGGPSTVEGTFVGSPGQMQVVGAIDLSTEPRFRVESDQRRYWRTGVYDRFTGDSWVRTGQPTDYQGPETLPDPPGPREELVQDYEALSEVQTIPGAADPVEVVGEIGRDTRVTRQGTLVPTKSVLEGSEYRVVSAVPDATPDQLRRAGTDYPEAVEEQYTQLPSSTSEEFRSVTEEVTSGADTPYETAERIESYLKQEKEYSTEIRKPGGNIANAFLLEMDAGYCTYFATTMVAMLRSEGVPARVAVGYTPGQSVGDDEYVVRGLNSHVWVEAYFPDYGWVRFDPTPAGPRENLEYEVLTGGRDGGGGGGSGGGGEDVPTVTETPTPTPTTTAGDGVDVNGTAPGIEGPTSFPGDRGQGDALDPGGATGNGTVAAPPSDDGGTPIPVPSRRQMALGAVSLLGLAAGAHRVGLGGRVARAVRLRYQPDAAPEAEVERAVARLELLLADRYRSRRTGETRREYADALDARGLDERARRVLEIHEQVRHAGEVDAATAAEAVRLVDDLVAETTPVVGRLRT